MREQNIGERGRVIGARAAQSRVLQAREAQGYRVLSSAQVNSLVALGRMPIVKLIV